MPVAAPTFVSATAEANMELNTANPETRETGNIAVQTGDLIVVRIYAEAADREVGNTITDNQGNAYTFQMGTEAGGKKWGKGEGGAKGEAVGSASQAAQALWTATASATGNVKVKCVENANSTDKYGILVEVWRGSGGVGSVKQANNEAGSTTPASGNITTSENSVLSCGNTDWNALSESAAWGGTGLGSFTDMFRKEGGSYSGYGGRASAGSAGTKTVTMNKAMRWCMIVVEIKGLEETGGAPPPQPLWGPGAEKFKTVFNQPFIPAPASFEQLHFRGRKDEAGRGANSTEFDYALDTNWNQVAGEIFRIRFEVEEDAPSGYGVQLLRRRDEEFPNGSFAFMEYKLNAGEWLPVEFDVTEGTATKAVITANAAGYTGSNPTTDVISGSSLPFVAGRAWEEINLELQTEPMSGSHTEIEWAMKVVKSKVTPGDTIKFRIAACSGRETVTPTITIVASGQQITLGQATETDAAFGISAKKLATLIPGSEVDTAQGVTIKKRVAITSATETDAAQTLSRKKLVALGQASETDSAVAPKITHKMSFTLSQATETDTAQAISHTLHRTLGFASETDTAVALAAHKRVTFTPASETDTAVALKALKRATFTVATETDSALTLSHGHRVTLTPGTESDAAQVLSALKKVKLTNAAETDSAVALTHKKVKTLTPATETDAAQIVKHLKRVTLVPAVETDEARAVSRVHAEVFVELPSFLTIAGNGTGLTVEYKPVVIAIQTDPVSLMIQDRKPSMGIGDHGSGLAVGDHGSELTTQPGKR